ncbi:PAS domain-containing protein (plasmid) [Sinorhizobium chiapasense]|uniref:histidine kinase n=1 Tax=Sinorhizobium chiapasense TaxID=501572 RepID=A0ABZ2BNB4_9HYPH
MIAMLPQQRAALMLTVSFVGIAASWLTTTPSGLLAPVAALFFYAHRRTAPLLLALLAIAFAGSMLAAFFLSDGMRDVASSSAAFFAVALCIGAVIAASMSASFDADAPGAVMRSTPGEGTSARINKWRESITGAGYEEGTAHDGPPSPSIEKTEEALRARERELSQLIDMVPSHLWRLTPDGEPTFFNRRMVDFLGMDVTDTDKPGTSRLEVVIGSVHPDDATELRDALSRCLVTGEGFAMRYRLRRADGAYRWMSSRAEPLRDQDGRIVQWYGLCHDIDDQVHAEEALRRSERQLQQLIDAVPALIWCTTPEGIPCYLNKRVTDVTGIRLKDLIAPDGSRYLTVVHPDDRDAVDRGLARSFETGESFVGRYRQRRSDGACRWVESRAEPLRDESGAIIQWYGVSVDIDDLIGAQEALRDRERELSQLVDMVPSLLWRLTANGEPTFFNERMVDFLGMDVSDADKPGMSRLETVIETVIHPDEKAELSNVLSRCLVTGKGFAMRYRLRRADGVYRWMSGRAEPLRDDSGHIVQWFGLCHDIDDQFRAEEALRRTSDRLAQATRVASLAELSASLAHEVNQPLAAIVASSHACHHWLSAEPPNVERAKITAERIIRSAGSAADVISRIRALFRPAAQDRSPEDVNHLIGEVCRLMAGEIAAKDVRIRTNLEPDLPPVALDRVQVQQVLVNLIRNGIEAMDAVVDASRALQIRSCRDGLNAIRVEVRDAGTGFKDAERAFEPFFTTKPHGMGMGLSICRSIIDSHGGRLWSADNQTHGATVAFTLPLGLSTL